jgi:hypothetical protein
VLSGEHDLYGVGGGGRSTGEGVVKPQGLVPCRGMCEWKSACQDGLHSLLPYRAEMCACWKPLQEARIRPRDFSCLPLHHTSVTPLTGTRPMTDSIRVT